MILHNNKPSTTQIKPSTTQIKISKIKKGKGEMIIRMEMGTRKTK